MDKKPVLAVCDVREDHIAYITRYWTSGDASFWEGMGLNPAKIPSAEKMAEDFRLMAQTADRQKRVCSLVWELNGVPVGYTTLKRIEFGVRADVHLHMWASDLRGRGYGVRFMQLALREFFRRFHLPFILCEPLAANPAPNAVMRKLGATFLGVAQMVPSELCHEVEAARYKITPDQVA
jgi:[ribosomal protein S5]-alanine N-acetyltransferase